MYVKYIFHWLYTKPAPSPMFGNLTGIYKYYCFDGKKVE